MLSSVKMWTQNPVSELFLHFNTIGCNRSRNKLKNMDVATFADTMTCRQTVSVLLKSRLQNVIYFTEEGGLENVNPRPVTALQRQREREEKRRKKAEKAAERKKKSKAAKGRRLLLPRNEIAVSFITTALCHCDPGNKEQIR